MISISHSNYTMYQKIKHFDEKKMKRISFEYLSISFTIVNMSRATIFMCLQTWWLSKFYTQTDWLRTFENDVTNFFQELLHMQWSVRKQVFEFFHSLKWLIKVKHRNTKKNLFQTIWKIYKLLRNTYKGLHVVL